MKNLKLIGFLMIVASSFMFIQCTSDPIPGQAGADGIDGVNGVDGVDGVGVQECIDCHSDTHRDPIYASYDLSGHAAGGAVGYAGSRASCAQCHSNEGYTLYQERGETMDWTNPTRIDCKTCHTDHSTFDFANDGQDYALRTIDPVTLITDPSYVLDFEGTSNMCIDCHQPRRLPPTSTDGTFEVTSSHWGPHHGPQATLLEGIQGAMIAGSEGYPGVGSAKHRTGASCVQCHMSASDGDDNGMHSWIKTNEGCVGCHSSGIPTEVDGLAAEMVKLAVLLENVEGVDEDGNPVKGIVHDGHPQEGTFTIKEAEAAWNYLLVMEDSSNGIHNPKYVKALIKNSIEALEQ